MAVVTLCSEYGSGGEDIGKALSSELGYDYFDRRLIEEVAKQAHVPERDVEEFDMDRHHRIKAFLSRFIDVYPFRGGEENFTLSVEEGEDNPDVPGGVKFEEILSFGSIDTHIYHDLTRMLIRELAEKDRVVIFGRGSQCILQEHANAVHVRIIGSLERRTANVASRENITLKEAKRFVEDNDIRRKEYVRYYYGIDATNTALYHMIINSDKCGIEDSVMTIKSFVERAEKRRK